MGRMVIVAYRPTPGGEADLEACVRDHLDVLRRRQLVTERDAIAGRAADGTIVEVFEWRSAEAIEAAHTDPEVGALWARFDACSTYVPVGELPEAAQLFSELEGLDW